MPGRKDINSVDLGKNLKRLAEISKWFSNQEEIDIEKGFEYVKEAAVIIKESKERLNKIENDFEEIKKDIECTTDEIGDEVDKAGL